MKPYNFALLRAPLQSLDKALQTPEITPLFEEAIYLSSIDLWQTLKETNLKKKPKVDESILKYWLRSCSRCTPFGIFAGSSVINLDNTTNLILESDDCPNRKVRLDMNYVTSIVSELEKDPILRKQLKFYVNNSLYESSFDLRYVEYIMEGSLRNFKLTSIEKTQYLTKLIAASRGGVTIDELAKELLVIENVSYEEAVAFVEQLCDSQILISDLEINITGIEPLEQLTLSLEKYENIEYLKQKFQNINFLLRQNKNGTKYYQNIIKGVEEIFSIGPNFKDIFQVDLFHSFKNNSIDESIIKKIADLSSKLLNLSVPSQNLELDDFKRRFTKKFEDSEVPLAIAIDSDLGIGYGRVNELNSGGSNWVDDLITNNKSSNESKLDILQHFVYDKYRDFLEKNLTEIEITSDDISIFEKNASKCRFSNGMHIMGALRKSNGLLDVNTFQFDLSGMGGPSGGNLLARFTHGDDILYEHTREVLQHEEDGYPNVVFAEIIHLPQARLGNVLLRPHLRKFELPYVGKSGLNNEFQLSVDDLLVSIQNDEIVLRSIKLDKRIIPRLTTAHNYKLNALPVYSFLCDIQNQGITYARLWHWGVLDNCRYLPRVVFKQIILKKAQWKLTYDDLKDLPIENVDYLDFFQKLRETFRLPENVLHVEGDNKLLINFNHNQSLILLVNIIKKKRSILLEEFLFTTDNCIVHDETGAPFTNEMIIPVKNDYQTIIYSETLMSFHKPKKYLPADGWLYYKIYSGIKTQERILTQYLLPFIENLSLENAYESFFFIRYSDDRPHLRIRFFNSDNEKQSKLQLNFSQFLISLYESQYIDSVVIDTYVQEVNRYKPNLTHVAENLFYNDSIAVLRFITMLDEQDSEFYRIVVGMRSVDMYLNDFNFSQNEKYDFFKMMANNYFKEFGSTNELKTQLNHKYKTNQKAILSHMNIENDVINGVEEAIDQFNIRSELNLPSVRKVFDELSYSNDKQDLFTLISSYIHMSINRIFIAKQRKYELIIYTFLERYYNSIIAKEKNLRE